MPTVTYTCQVCGTTKRSYRSADQLAKGGLPRYCSRRCFGIAQRGDGNPRWTGGRSVKDGGYIVVWKDGRRDFEHRFVMEEKLGRRLRTDEHVHHINHNRGDNRPENLELIGASEHGHHHKGYRRYETRPCVICGTAVTRRAKDFRRTNALCGDPACKSELSRRTVTERASAQTHCANGHQRVPGRPCPACARDRQRAYRARKTA